MIFEEYDSNTWGSQSKAITARSRRARELEEDGYEIDYAARPYGLRGETYGFRLFAYMEPFEGPDMVTPEKEKARQEGG